MTTGLDPELLAISGTKLQHIVPAQNFVPAPYRDESGALNQLSYDNAAVEIRPKEAHDLEMLTSATGLLLRLASTALEEARKKSWVPATARLSFIPAARLTLHDSVLSTMSTFGCSPSLTVQDDYGSLTSFIPNHSTLYRSAGFHIHQDMLYPTNAQPIVAILDGLLGLMDVIVNNRLGWSDASRSRRISLGYGRAGEYRTRDVGDQRILEYRVMSPWVLSHPKYILWATSTMKDLCKLTLDELLRILDEFPRREGITLAINTSNDVLALHFWSMCHAVWAVGENRARQSLFGPALLGGHKPSKLTFAHNGIWG